MIGAHSAPDPFAGMLGDEFVPGVLVRHWSGRQVMSPRVRAWLFWIGAPIVTFIACVCVFAASAAIAV